MKNLYYKFGNLLWLLLTLSISAFAQDADTTYAARIKYIFKYLDKSKVPTAMLKDAAFELAELSNYNGLILADSNLVYDQNFRDIYLTLASSQLGYLPSGLLPNPKLVDSIWLSKRKTGQVTLAGLYYQYNRFADDAFNKVTVINDQIYDKYVNGIWQNPYITEQVIAFTPAITEQAGLNFSLLLPAQLWLSNNKQQVSKIEVDMNDGLGYRQLSPNVGLPVLYADSGLKILKFKLSLSNNTILQSRSLLHVSKLSYESTPINPGYDLGVNVDNIIPELEEDTPVSVIPQGWGLSDAQYKRDYFIVASTETYNNDHAVGQVIVQYANADKQIRKPLIVVEGLDPANHEHPEIAEGDLVIDDFFKKAGKSDDLNDLLVDLPQYDIIYINWKNGTADMHLNALLVKTVIRSINQVKVADGANPLEKNVVMGQSMGGVIARYALKKMELEGENHDTRLYISHDAPHQGANVPLGFQAMAIHVQKMALTSFVTAATCYFAAGSNRNLLFLNYTPAAKQLLSHRIDWNYFTDDVIHNQWQAELINLGYPQNCRNISLSNGSECGTPIPIIPGANLFLMHGNYKPGFWGDLLGMIAMPIAGAVLKNAKIALLGLIPGSNKLTYHFEANSMADGGGNQLYKGYVKYTKKILWTISVTTTITDKSYTAPAGMMPLDQLPGSYFEASQIQAPANTQFNFVPFFSFIPTTSALDIGKGQVTLTQADYYQQFVGATPPPAPKNTPFDNFITAFSGGTGSNEEHISFTNRNGKWLADELNIQQLQADCSYFCSFSSNTILGPSCFDVDQNYNVQSLPLGSSIKWSVLGPAIIVGSDNQSTVNLSGTGIGTVTLFAKILSGECGQKTVLRSLNVGILTPQITLTSFTQGNVPVYFKFNVTNPTPNLIYKWYVNNVLKYTSLPGESLFQYTGQCNAVYHIKCTASSNCLTSGFSNELGKIVGCLSAYIISPNPANEELIIKYNPEIGSKGNGTIYDRFELILYDENGGIVSQKISHEANNKVVLDTYILPNGIYYLHIKQGDQLFKKQVIIQHD
jgi:hypothetical protein